MISFIGIYSSFSPSKHLANLQFWNVFDVTIFRMAHLSSARAHIHSEPIKRNSSHCLFSFNEAHAVYLRNKKCTLKRQMCIVRYYTFRESITQKQNGDDALRCTFFSKQILNFLFIVRRRCDHRQHLFAVDVHDENSIFILFTVALFIYLCFFSSMSSVHRVEQCAAQNAENECKTITSPQFMSALEI